MNDEFLRAVDDGTGTVALFEREQQGAGDRVFALRRDLLRARLAERQRQMLDTAEEERALASLDRALEEAAR
ncbi:MAG: hypothetical protein DMF66_19035 [Acidobacteria bacterium]|nr:MAG: hypothetical protein DMF66_19035 [Acidobacteriota bacterium]